MKKEHLKYAGVVGIAGMALVGASVGGAVAANQIGSDDIKNQSIQSVDLAKDSVGTSELKPGAVYWTQLSEKLQGEIKALAGKQGPQGEPGKDGTNGTNGAPGAKGDKGDTGMVDVQKNLTGSNDAYNGLTVVDVPPSPIGGTNDSETPLVSLNLDKGRYLIDATAQFFHFTSGEGGLDYGVISLKIGDNASEGHSWTPDIPQGANGAQTNAPVYVTINNDNTTVTVVGTIRGTVAGQAGAQIIATRVGDAPAQPPV